MAPSPPPAVAAAWSVTASLRYRGGLEIHATAENILPGWGRGGERLSFLLRLRRRLRLAVTFQCGRALAPAEPNGKPRALKLLRFLRSRLPRVPSVWRRKKPPPQRAAAAAPANPGSRTPAIPSLLKNRALLLRPAATTSVLCLVAALAVAAASVAALRLVAGFMISNASCTSWRCFLAKKFINFLGPPLFEWLSKMSLKSVKFLEPPLFKWLSLKWLFNK